MRSLLSNTEELLLLCSQKDLTEGLKKKAQALIKEGISWQRFLEFAMRGGVTILVYDSLREISPSGGVPQFVLDRLRSAYLFVTARITNQYIGLKDLLNLFATKKIPALPLKGMILAKRLYADIAARGLSVDYDLLIEAKNRESARSFLEEAGYSFNPVDQIIKPWQYLFTKSKARPVDLHWDITRLYRSKERIDGFWKGARPVVEDGVSYYEFKEEELLLYLSAQIFDRCCFTRLIYLCDIHQLLHKYKQILDWDNLVKKAKRWRLSNPLYAALNLSRDLFNSDLPVEILERLKPSPLKVMLLNLFANKKVIFRSRFRKLILSNFLSYIFFELIEAKSPQEYLSIIFPPKEVRDKDWTARIVKGLPALLSLLPKRESMGKPPRR